MMKSKHRVKEKAIIGVLIAGMALTVVAIYFSLHPERAYPGRSLLEIWNTNDVISRFTANGKLGKLPQCPFRFRRAGHGCWQLLS